jgi:hypothetical protein
MKQVLWVIVIGLAVVLVTGPPLPAAAMGGGGHGSGGGGMSGGFHGGGEGMGMGMGGGFQGGHGQFHGGPGNFHGGHGEFHGNTRVFIGGFGWWGWPGWWGLGWWATPYPYYYGYASPVVVQQAPTQYIQQDPGSPSAAPYWYYCPNAGAYYPYVKDCPGGWMQVVPQPASPGR